MGRQSRIIAVLLFTLKPGREKIWQTAWTDLATLAADLSDCRGMELLTDPNDGTHSAVWSQWENRQALHTFWRNAGINWIDDALDYSASPMDVLIFERLPTPEVRLIGVPGIRPFPLIVERRDARNFVPIGSHPDLRREDGKEG